MYSRPYIRILPLTPLMRGEEKLERDCTRTVKTLLQPICNDNPIFPLPPSPYGMQSNYLYDPPPPSIFCQLMITVLYLYLADPGEARGSSTKTVGQKFNIHHFLIYSDFFLLFKIFFLF